MPAKKKLLTADQRRFLKEAWLFVLDIVYNAVIIIALVILIRTFLISPFRVIGSSMADTLHNGEFILINKLSYRLFEPERGDPIVFRPPITNKNAQKFNLTVTTDAQGIATINLRPLEVIKDNPYCQTAPLRSLWLCKQVALADDLIYFRPADNASENDSVWRTSQKEILKPEHIQSGTWTLRALPFTRYDIRIYDHAGPEFFVKRIIGIPGDTVKIENGRVYLKTPSDLLFREINEPFLNDENRNQTYFPQRMATTEFTVPAGHYFVLGDNRNHSNDSRSWFSPIDQSYTPFVSKQDISGKVLIVLWPLMELRLIPSASL